MIMAVLKQEQKRIANGYLAANRTMQIWVLFSLGQCYLEFT